MKLNGTIIFQYLTHLLDLQKHIKALLYRKYL